MALMVTIEIIKILSLERLTCNVSLSGNTKALIKPRLEFVLTLSTLLPNTNLNHTILTIWHFKNKQPSVSTSFFTKHVCSCSPNLSTNLALKGKTLASYPSQQCLYPLSKIGLRVIEQVFIIRPICWLIEKCQDHTNPNHCLVRGRQEELFTNCLSCLLVKWVVIFLPVPFPSRCVWNYL